MKIFVYRIKVNEDNTFEVLSQIREEQNYSVFIVREQPWPVRDGNLLW